MIREWLIRALASLRIYPSPPPPCRAGVGSKLLGCSKSSQPPPPPRRSPKLWPSNKAVLNDPRGSSRRRPKRLLTREKLLVGTSPPPPTQRPLTKSSLVRGGRRGPGAWEKNLLAGSQLLARLDPAPQGRFPLRKILTPGLTVLSNPPPPPKKGWSEALPTRACVHPQRKA